MEAWLGCKVLVGKGEGCRMCPWKRNEEGFGRGFGKEYPHYLKIARGEARESMGRFERLKGLLPVAVVQERIATLHQIIGGLTRSIMTLEKKRGV